MIEYQRSKQGEDEIVVRHVYIERRMTPLNIWLQEGRTSRWITASSNTATPSRN
jgi:isocitrate dehydrogenase kinase/phosphatase